MIKTRFIVAIGLLMTLACCSNSGTDQTLSLIHISEPTRH